MKTAKFALLGFLFSALNMLSIPVQAQPVQSQFSGNILLVNGQPTEITGFDYFATRGKEFVTEYGVCQCVFNSIVGHHFPPCQPISQFDISPSRIAYDMQQIASTHANTIRTYGNVNATLLNAANNNGLKVLDGLELPWSADYSLSSVTGPLTATILTHVNTYKNHPAILGWVMGNETEQHLNCPPSPQSCAPQQTAFFNYLNSLAQSIKTADPNHIVGPVIAWDQNFITQLEAQPNIDFIGANTFGYSTNGFSAGVLTAVTQKGYFISEYTTDRIRHNDLRNNFNNFVEDERTRANLVYRLAKQIRKTVAGNYNGGTGRLVGGLYEAYTDGPSKSANGSWDDACYHGVDQDGWEYYNGMDNYEDREFLGAFVAAPTTANPDAVAPLETANKLSQIWAP